MAITYEYACGDCGFNFEASQSIKATPLIECPQCGENSLARVLSGGLCAFVDAGITDKTSLANLAERNTSRMGKTELEDRRHQDQENKLQKKNLAQQELARKYGTEPIVYKEPVKGKVGADKINKMTASQKKKYIEKGTT